MEQNGLPLLEEVYERVPELLRSHGLTIEPFRDIGEFKVWRCCRDGVAVLLSTTKPAHWRAASDIRRNLMVVALIGESLFRFWRIPREHRLRREVVELLRPLAWKGVEKEGA